MFENKRLLLIALMACIFSSTLGAQTHSPYSRYGYGILSDQATGVSKAMGGASYGIRNSLSANFLNPASYTAVDSLTFLFDVSVYANRSMLKDDLGSRSDFNGGLDYVTLLLPVSRRLGLSAGLVPYSSVGYDFGSEETAGGVGYLKSYTGSSGISQAYIGVGYELPVKGLSIGANASYLFGKLKHSRSISQITGASSEWSQENTEFRVSTFKIDFGAQYSLDINKDNRLTLGATFSPKMNSKADYDSYLSSFRGTQRVSVDTLSVNSADAGMPLAFGLGGAWNYKRNWTVAADITYQKWSDVKYSSLLGDGLADNDRFNDRWKYNAGAEYVIDPYNRNFFKKIRFRGGANYSNSYMNVINATGQVKGYDEYGATFGFGLPILDRQSFGNRTSYININFEYKKIKPKTGGMISENYYGVSVSANLNELWFYKKKIQ